MGKKVVEVENGDDEKERGEEEEGEDKRKRGESILSQEDGRPV